MSRRRLLAGVATVGAAGTLAGCSADDGGDGGGTEPPATVDAPEAVSDYLSETSNFDGTMLDLTDRDSPSVAVGAEGNGAQLAFDPAAIKVGTGTTVTWEWTGEGGTHNVVAEDGAFRSGEAVESSSETYEYTFDSTGTFPYYCKPHASVGMKGAVVVE